MSLKVYTTYEEIPKELEFVFNNAGFFRENTKLTDDEFTREILKDIEGARYIDEEAFLDDKFGVMNRNELSVTGKTLLNLYHNPDKCVSLVECDLDSLEKLGKIHDGAVYWPWTYWSYESPCDIEFQGKKYYNMGDLMTELDRLDAEKEEMEYKALKWD